MNRDDIIRILSKHEVDLFDVHELIYLYDTGGEQMEALIRLVAYILRRIEHHA